MLLLSFRYAPEDEVEQVRALLKEEHIDFYEVPPSFMGFNAGGIWLANPAQKQQAQLLLAQYQAQRAQQAQARWASQKRDGTQPTQWDHIKAHPFRFLLTLLGIVFLLGLMTLPFWQL